MSYRDDVEALRMRKDLLEKELAELDARARELSGLEAQKQDVRRRLEETERMIAGATRRTLPMLDAVRIASPCDASWDQMKGDDQVRFCGKCEKNVYNLSAMSRDQAEALLREREGNLCARLYRRSDGTVITNDCPVGARKKRVRRAVFAVVGGGALAALSAAFTLRGAGAGCPSPMQGDVAVQGGAVAMPTDTVVATGSVATPPPPPPQPTMMGKVASPHMGAVAPPQAPRPNLTTTPSQPRAK